MTVQLTQIPIWRPPPFEKYNSPTSISGEFGPNLDLALQSIFGAMDNANGGIVNINNEIVTINSQLTTINTALLNRVLLPKNVTNKAIAVGHNSVTGNLNAVATGLSVVSDVIGSIDNGSTALNYWLSIRPSGTAGAIDIFTWMPTAIAVTTPIAATGAVTVRWIAYGSQ